MKNNKKFILAAGAAALGLVAATGVTSGFAWFTAANTVTVRGLNMKAAAEEGIVIANTTTKGESTWATSVNAAFTSTDDEFIPTSTADFGTWYHNVSNTSTTHTGAGSCEAFTLSEAEKEGANAGTTGTQVLNAKKIFLLNKFYIQSAGAEAQKQDIFVQDLSVSGNTGSQNLDKALRVGIKSATAQKIFAPLAAENVAYQVGTGRTNVTAIASTADPGVVVTAGANGITIPAYTAAGTSALEFNVYIWFEGEDTNCKSENITATLDTLSIEFKFGNRAHPQA